MAQVQIQGPRLGLEFQGQASLPVTYAWLDEAGAPITGDMPVVILPLNENMCFAVHPGYDDGRVFAVICDNYMIGADGPGECLHKTEKKIFEL